MQMNENKLIDKKKFYGKIISSLHGNNMGIVKFYRICQFSFLNKILTYLKCIYVQFDQRLL